MSCSIRAATILASCLLAPGLAACRGHGETVMAAVSTAPAPLSSGGPIAGASQRPHEPAGLPAGAARPGFFVKVEDGRLWVFRQDSPALRRFLEEGEPAKVVIRPRAGPGGMTIKSTDAETIDAYLAAR